eukprot:UN16547
MRIFIFTLNSLKVSNKLSAFTIHLVVLFFRFTSDATTLFPVKLFKNVSER